VTTSFVYSECSPFSSRFFRNLSPKPTWFDEIRSNDAPQTGHFSANSSCSATLQLPQRIVRRSTRIEVLIISIPSSPRRWLVVRGRIPLRPKFFRQFTQPLHLSVLLDVIERLTIDAWRSIVGLTNPIGVPQHVGSIHFVVQRERVKNLCSHG
jgi:hypothetical protein